MAIRHHGLFTLAHSQYQHARQGCYIYGSTGEGIDTGVIIEGEGVLFISKLALREMAEVAGFAVNEDGQALEEENAHLVHELAVAKDRIEQLEDDLTAFGRAIANAQSGRYPGDVG